MGHERRSLERAGAPRRLLPFFVVALLLCQGCLFHNVGAIEKLRDSVYGFNDELRWSRIELAADRVDGPYQHRFRATRHRWGRVIQIADLEVLHLKMSSDRGKASSVIAVRWSSASETILRETIIGQNWKRAGATHYVLTSEKILEGDERLLEPPKKKKEAPEDEASAHGAPPAERSRGSLARR